MKYFYRTPVLKSKRVKKNPQEEKKKNLVLKDKASYENWKSAQLKYRKQYFKYNMTPHDFYIT